MIAGIIQALFESIGEIIFLVLGVRRALALIFFALGLLTLNSGKFESSGIFLGISVILLAWDTAARYRTIRKSDS